MDAVKTIKELGGLSAAARALGLSVSTVQYWQEENRIPKWRWESVARALAAKPAEPSSKPKRTRKVAA